MKLSYLLLAVVALALQKAAGQQFFLDCPCPKVDEPVCGSDGSTYPNECVLTKCAARIYPGLKMVSKGPCPAAPAPPVTGPKPPTTPTVTAPKPPTAPVPKPPAPAPKPPTAPAPKPPTAPAPKPPTKPAPKPVRPVVTMWPTRPAFPMFPSFPGRGRPLFPGRGRPFFPGRGRGRGRGRPFDPLDYFDNLDDLDYFY